MRGCPHPAVACASQPRPLRECPRRVERGKQQWLLALGDVEREEQVYLRWPEGARKVSGSLDCARRPHKEFAG